MLKKLGFGMDGDERYRRAFDKGVLLGDFNAAARLFTEAAQAYQKSQNTAGNRQALANAYLYQYIQNGDAKLLGPLIELLRSMESIEAIGSVSDTIPAAHLAQELEARQLELALKSAPADAPAATLAQAHDRIAQALSPIRGEKLTTYRYVGDEALNDTVESRFYLHLGHASWNRARARAYHDPAAAADEMSQAVIAFRRAGHKPAEEETAKLLAQMRLARTCWVCGREMQAQKLHFDYMPTTVQPYHLSLLQKLNQDVGMLDIENSQAAVCVVCCGLMTNRAKQAAEPLKQQITRLEEQVAQLGAIIQRLRARLPGT